MAMRPISYEVDGFPAFIRSEASARKAIERGHITADTQVIAYGDNDERERIRAIEHPMLRPLLGGPAELEQPRETAPPVEGQNIELMLVEEARSEPTVPHEQPNRVETEEQPSPAIHQPEPEPQPFETHAEFDAPLPKRRGTNMTWLLVLPAVGLVLLAISAMDKSTDPIDSATPASHANASPSSEAEPENIVVLFATREIAVRTRASASSSRVTLLPRGTRFAGFIVPSATDSQYRWLRITEGDYAGNFVSELNLSNEERPQLDTSQSGIFYLTENTIALSRPDKDASEMTEPAWHLKSGQQLDLAGITGTGFFFNGWAEVMLPEGSGVAYVPFDRLSRTAPNETEAATEDAIETSTDAPVPRVAGQTYKLRLESCSTNSIGLILRYRNADGIQVVSVDLNPSEQGMFSVGSRPETLVSDEIYFTYYRVNGRRQYEDGDVTTYFNGRQYNLRRLKFENKSGTLFASFDC